MFRAESEERARSDARDCCASIGNENRDRRAYQVIRLICAIVLQLASFGSFAGSSSSSLLVTVTVVRPAPVTSVSDTSTVPVAVTDAAQGETKTANPVINGVQYVTVNY
jgi:hypothetical protein